LQNAKIVALTHCEDNKTILASLSSAAAAQIKKDNDIANIAI